MKQYKIVMLLDKLKIPSIFILLFIILDVYGQTNDEININKVDQYLNNNLHVWKVPGMAVSIVANDSIIFQKGYGVLLVNSRDSVDENTIFAIGSNTKPFTTSALATLVEDGKLGWNNKVFTYIPNFRMYNYYVTTNITIADILSHRSGLKTFSGDLIWYGSSYTRKEVLEKIQYLNPVYSFREEFGYSNLMYVVAGEIIEAITMQSWDTYVDSLFFKSLKMNRTITTIRKFNEFDNIATPHIKKNNEVIPITYINWDNVAPAGGINSSVSDMTQWIKFQLNGNGKAKYYSTKINNELWKIHTKQTIYSVEKELWSNLTDKGYGLGWQIYEYDNLEIIYHFGAVDGMISVSAMIPEMNFGFVILTNSNMNLPLALMYYIIDEYLGNKHIDYSKYLYEYYKQIEKDQEYFYTNLKNNEDTSIKPDRSITDFTGIYHCDVYGNASVKIDENELWIEFEKSPIFIGKTRHYKGNKFWIEMVKVPSLPLGIVNFEIKEDYIYMTIDIPNPDFDFKELDFKKKLAN